MLDYRTNKIKGDCNSYIIESPDVHLQVCNTIPALKEFERIHGRSIRVYTDEELMAK